MTMMLKTLKKAGEIERGHLAGTRQPQMIGVIAHRKAKVDLMHLQEGKLREVLKVRGPLEMIGRKIFLPS